MEHGLNWNSVDEAGRNHLHVALAPPGAPTLEGIEYLVRAGVPVNARDCSGKIPLAYWREPHGFETHWFRTWLFERLSGESSFQRERENRARISKFLEQAGASL